MELHLKNVDYLYSACSNPTNFVLLIVLSIIIGKGLDNGTAKFYRCVEIYRAVETVSVFEMEFCSEKDIFDKLIGIS